MRRVHFASFAFGLLVGCGGGTSEMPCPAATCLQGLTITLTTPPAGAYRVEAIGPGETAPHGQDCSGAGPCLIFFPGYQPVTVTISVITATGTTTYNKTPTYTTVFPNGPDCGACVAGAATVP